MLKNYFIIAWRNLKRNKVFSVINIAGLSAGIAASLLLFIIVSYEMSYEKFQKSYNNIYHVVTQIKFSDGMSYNPGIAYLALPALRTEMPDIQFAGIDCIYGSQVMVPNGTAENSKKFIEDKGIFFAEPEFFKVFDSYQWLAGSAAVLGEPNSMVLSKSQAAKYFGNWQQALGKTLVVDNAFTAKVNGILEDVPQNTDLPLMVLISYKTMKPHGDNYGYNEDWGNVSSNHQMYALLPPNVTPDNVNKRLLQFSKAHYTLEKGKANFLQPLADMHSDTRFPLFGEPGVSKTTLWTLSLIGIVIIVMACINFINLSTAQAVNRSREVGIRKVLGGNRAGLFRQMMGETAIIVGIAVVIALMAVHLSLPFVKHIASIEEELNLFTPKYLLLLAALSVVVTLLAGLYPAFVLSGFNPITALRNRISTAKSGSISLRRGLVITQFAISQVLIIATIVAISQMDFISKADLGFNKDAVLVLYSNTDSLSLARQDAFKQQLLALPGVQNVSFNSDMPSSDNGMSTNFAYNQQPGEKYQLYLKFGDENYLNAYGMQLVAGRNYAASDTVNEILVNESLAKRLSPNKLDNVIGKTIRFGGGRWNEIVGVVKDFKTTSLREEVRPLAITTRKSSYSNIAIKLHTSNLQAAQNSIERLWNQNYPEYAYNAQFFEDTINAFYRQEQQLSLLYKIFAGLAIFISCLGLYGLVSFMAVQKTKEVGIRKVLGAGISHIVFIFSKEFTLLIIVAFVIAAPVAWYVSNNWLQSFAYRIHIGIWIFIVAILASVIIAWITVGYKAVRAAIVNPVKSLRSE
ncbi:FtsX-like permease family protein [Ilyomonas limi]|uniref:FtsX-like permease family protein n=1 Tax=Ilyomonas limi TaxID=2575867 RepID=A0A4U3KZM3_9BACT|nr:ABC transporter permease [Ilyomonas limi]TKK68251.1 FtsX-like permease family protein [Ilyomonas limi]